MTEIQNKFPGKDVTPEDLATKFPLVAKRDPEHFSRFTVAGVEFGGKEVPIMAGPNMVESKELIIDIAKNVKQRGAHFLRGGAFKPLTFPYRSAKYNETREQGIEWLGAAKRASKGSGLRSATAEAAPACGSSSASNSARACCESGLSASS